MKITHYTYNAFTIEEGNTKIAIDPGQNLKTFHKKSLIPESEWNDLHLQIIFYGREYCTARGCDGTKCPLCQELYPRRRKPVVWKKP